MRRMGLVETFRMSVPLRSLVLEKAGKGWIRYPLPPPRLSGCYENIPGGAGLSSHIHVSEHVL